MRILFVFCILLSIACSLLVANSPEGRSIFPQEVQQYPLDSVSIELVNAYCETEIICLDGIEGLSEEEQARERKEAAETMEQNGSKCFFDFKVRTEEPIQLLYLEFGGFRYRFVTEDRAGLEVEEGENLRFIIGDRIADKLEISFPERLITLAEENLSGKKDFENTAIYLYFEVDGSIHIGKFELSYWVG